MTELLALGISHKTAPLELRERVALTEGRAAGLLSELASAPEIQEAAAISTCNRTEIYLVASDPVGAESLALGVLAREAGTPPTELVGRLYSLRGAEAALHLFRVTAGLDSMIIGEAEVQGQVKRAYELALVEGATGPLLNRLFRGALAAGKRARTETGITERGVSVPSVAVRACPAGARRALEPARRRRRRRRDRGARRSGARRPGRRAGVHRQPSHDRAIGLAERFGGRAIRFEELPEQIGASRHRRRLHRIAAQRDRARGDERGDEGSRGAVPSC